MKIFMIIYILSRVYVTFDPYVYMCIVVYTENKEEIMMRLSQILPLTGHDTEADIEDLKKKSNRINMFLYS